MWKSPLAITGGRAIIGQTWVGRHPWAGRRPGKDIHHPALEGGIFHMTKDLTNGSPMRLI